MKLGTFTKQPGERLSSSIDYSDALDSGDTVDSIMSCLPSPEGLTASATLLDGSRVRIWVEGGDAGVSYKISVRVGTTGGERFEDEITCKVKEI
jgi:hypothetical protein